MGASISVGGRLIVWRACAAMSIRGAGGGARDKAQRDEDFQHKMEPQPWRGATGGWRRGQWDVGEGRSLCRGEMGWRASRLERSARRGLAAAGARNGRFSLMKRPIQDSGLCALTALGACTKARRFLGPGPPPLWPPLATPIQRVSLLTPSVNGHVLSSLVDTSLFR